jgi:hypothetical protein
MRILLIEKSKKGLCGVGILYNGRYSNMLETLSQ